MRLRWLCCLLLPALVSAGCQGPPSREVRAGAELYRLNCASCHGADADGNGPVAPFIKAQVPDLTRIATRRDGTFPSEEIFKIIDGQSNIAAHGPRHMPVWGYEFFDPQADDEHAHGRSTERIEKLVSYLGTLQRRE